MSQAWIRVRLLGDGVFDTGPVSEGAPNWDVPLDTQTLLDDHFRRSKVPSR